MNTASRHHTVRQRGFPRTQATIRGQLRDLLVLMRHWRCCFVDRAPRLA